MDLLEHFRWALEQAEDNASNLSPLYSELFPVPGMSGKRTRALLNNVCNADHLGQPIRYLEVGLWQGSTFFSALHGNRIHAVGIDDWSQFSEAREGYALPKDVFGKFLPTFMGENDVMIGEGDCFTFFPDERFNVYFYDGEHSVLSQYRALSHFISSMDDTFIWLVDDYKSPEVREATRLVINDLGLNRLHEAHLGLDRRTEDDEWWWSGLYAAVLRKP
jgi:hypothetical protein